MMHVNKYRTIVESPSARIGDTEPENLRDSVEEMSDGLLVLFQVEENDTGHQVNRICKDIKKVAEKVGTSRLMIGAFAHLSHSRPNPDEAKKIAQQVISTCKDWMQYEVDSSHFGYNKSTVIDVKGHQHSVKYRSY